MTLAAKLMTVVGLVMLAVCLLLAGQRNEARRQRDAAMRDVAALNVDRAALRSSLAQLQAAVSAQNAALDQWAADAQLRQQAGDKALLSAQRTTQELQERNRVLRTIIQTTHPESCDATFDAARAARAAW